MTDTQERETSEEQENPLKTVPVGKLMMKFAIPSIVAMLVGAVYKNVDNSLLDAL